VNRVREPFVIKIRLVSKLDQKHRGGFTLVELVSVVAILALVACLAVTRVTALLAHAREEAARRDLATLRAAYLDPADGLLRDLRGLPGFSPGFLRVGNLFVTNDFYVGVADAAARTTGFRLGDPRLTGRRCLPADRLMRRNTSRDCGWNGPYVKRSTGEFPSEDAVRRAGDATFGARGFFPSLDGLRLPEDFIVRRHGCSIYGYPGEPALLDPWGNPYVLQIPPPQAFRGATTNLPDEVRFRFARVVSAGADGVLSTPCFRPNVSNAWETSWSADTRRLCRQAGRLGTDISARGDDLVLFLLRNDTDEEADE